MLTNAMTWMNPENLLSDTSHLAPPGGLWELDDPHMQSSLLTAPTARRPIAKTTRSGRQQLALGCPAQGVRGRPRGRGDGHVTRVSSPP